MICPYCLKEMKSGWLQSDRGAILFSEKKKTVLWRLLPHAAKDDIRLSHTQFSWFCPGCEKIVIDVMGKSRYNPDRALTDTDVSERNITIGEWSYRMPDFSRGPDGRLILIDRYSFQSPEASLWGLDADNEPFAEHHRSDEGAWFEDSVEADFITKEQLADEIERLSDFFAENGCLDWAGAYQNILVWLQSDSGGSSLQIPNS